MDTWKPELPPKYSPWQPSEPEVESEVSFWKPSSDPQGSIWIPSSASGGGGGGCFWKPSNWKPSPGGGSEQGTGFCNWKWTPSSESDEVTGNWKWTPSSESDEVTGWKPSSQPKPEESDPSLKHNSNSNSRLGTGCFLSSNLPVENFLRSLRRYGASRFSKAYKFIDGNKSCVWSNDMRRWTGECYDTVWVAVHGVDSICMVTWLQDLDMTRVGSSYQRYCSNLQTLRGLAEAVISEVECLPYGDENLTEKSDLGIEVPFGVVSVIGKASDETAHMDTSVPEYDEKKAIEFLKEKITSGAAFTYDETIQTAISAFQHLCRKELKAEDIWVSAWNTYQSTEHLRFKQKKEHLDVIRGVSCGSSSSGSSTNSGCHTNSDNEWPVNIVDVINNVIAARKKLKCFAA